MSVSDQIKRLKDSACVYKTGGFPEVSKLLLEAADTIEFFSAKLKTENAKCLSNLGHGSIRWVYCKERLPEMSFDCTVTVIETDPTIGKRQEAILPYSVRYSDGMWKNLSGEKVPFEVIAWVSVSEGSCLNHKCCCATEEDCREFLVSEHGEAKIREVEGQKKGFEERAKETLFEDLVLLLLTYLWKGGSTKNDDR